MDREDLRAFVVDAHRNGYATSEPDVDEEQAGKVLEYEDGNWHYVDRYYGSRSFVGCEVVIRAGTATWGMHYYGRPSDESVDYEPVYAFLRDALARATTEHPFRGPKRYEDGEFSYRTDVDGSVEAFRGIEVIERDGEEAYRGQYGGGLVE